MTVEKGHPSYTGDKDELRAVIFEDESGVAEEAVSPAEGRDRLAAYLYRAWLDTPDLAAKTYVWGQLLTLTGGEPPTPEMIIRFTQMDHEPEHHDAGPT